MRGKMVSKIILVLIIGVALLVMPRCVFATSGGPANLDQFWEEQETTGDPVNPDPVNPNPVDPKPADPKPADPEPEKKEETLPDAGLAEDTMMVIAVIALGTIAVFSNKKVKEYNNI